MLLEVQQNTGRNPQPPPNTFLRDFVKMPSLLSLLFVPMGRCRCTLVGELLEKHNTSTAVD